MSGEVLLTEIDDELAAQIRGRRTPTRRFAEGFPRTEDLEPLEARERGALSYVVVEDGLVVGTCGTHGRAARDGSIELGWGLVESARGHGVGSAAVAHLLVAVRARYPTATLVARTEWSRGHDGMAADSPASEAILARFGFEPGPVPGEPGLRTWRLEPQADASR